MIMKVSVHLDDVEQAVAGKINTDIPQSANAGWLRHAEIFWNWLRDHSTDVRAGYTWVVRCTSATPAGRKVLGR